MSHPPWVRGLKRRMTDLHLPHRQVAPPVGAWIETISSIYTNYIKIVAPPVGAWIETTLCRNTGKEYGVAPPVGAWIETTVCTLLP